MSGETVTQRLLSTSIRQVDMECCKIYDILIPRDASGVFWRKVGDIDSMLCHEIDMMTGSGKMKPEDIRRVCAQFIFNFKKLCMEERRGKQV